MTIYPITRFFIESLRSDEAPVLGTGLSIAQNVSLLLLACAAGLWFYVLCQPLLPRSRAKPSDPSANSGPSSGLR
jgi:prolipoprotein diacylglyceryltransferase